jgi:DNA repair ATPase RecN
MSSLPKPIAAGSSGGDFRRLLLAQTVAAKLETVGIVNDAVDDGVGECRLAEHGAMP